MIESIEKNMLLHEQHLSDYATKDQEAIHLQKYIKDIRPSYFRDIDKIIHSESYTKYLDKTQVFSLIENDNISKRMVHVSLVSKLARTIGRALSLNEDLIEAIALGHDLGHTPFGHVGENILNELSLLHDGTYFNHNVQSVRLLMDIENKGKGMNITLQTLDGILCHNGELFLDEYKPVTKTKEEFLTQYHKTYTDHTIVPTLVPMTLEGCVVRICDIIGYVGRDIEDAIRLNVLDEKDIPDFIKKTLGTNNKEIINTIVLDVINNSYNKPYIGMSKEVFDTLKKLKDFNYEYIYSKANSKEQISIFKNMFSRLFEIYLKQLKNNQYSEDIFKLFLHKMDKRYLENTTNERIVIDYIASMTDDFFMKQYDKYRTVN